MVKLAFEIHVRDGVVLTIDDSKALAVYGSKTKGAKLRKIGKIRLVKRELCM